MKKNNKKGFTLIELLVVIAIIGLLSTLAVVSLNSARTKARDARRQSDLKQISTAMELYMSQNDRYPTFGTCADGVIAANNSLKSAIAVTNLCTNGVKDANSTYLQQVPVDPSPDATTDRYYYYHTDTASPAGLNS